IVCFPQLVSCNVSYPKDHIIWSLRCFVYSNPFCLGLAALIFSIKYQSAFFPILCFIYCPFWRDRPGISSVSVDLYPQDALQIGWMTQT
uniref:Uncharacterized protein n=1 Tax=Anabas testudineus TaxID=64144 RepID=A0A7N6FBB4_ANATE